MIITLEDAKAHLNVTGSDDDALIIAKIEAADSWVGHFLGYPTALCTASNNHAPVQEAARQLVAHWYENREATLVGASAEIVPFGVYDLLRPYREWVF